MKIVWMSFVFIIRLVGKENKVPPELAFAYIASASIERAGLFSFGNNHIRKSLCTHDGEGYGHSQLLTISRTFRVSILGKN